MAYILQHTRIGFCWWDLLALIVVVGVVVYWVVKNHKYKKAKKELEDQLTSFSTDAVITPEETTGTV